MTRVDMFAEQWSHVVTASVAPVVIISAAALLCLAFYNRLAAIVTRIRAVQRERLDTHLRLDGLSPAQVERYSAFRETCIMESLEEQTSRMRRRARLIRFTLLSLLTAIGSLVLCAAMNGLTILLPAAAVAAACFFTLGLMLLLAAVVSAGMELLIALGPAELESEIVTELTGFSRHANQSV